MHFLEDDFALIRGNPINGEQSTIEKTLSSLTRRGRTVDCLVSVTPLRSADGGTTGVIILMDEAVGNI